MLTIIEPLFRTWICTAYEFLLCCKHLNPGESAMKHFSLFPTLYCGLSSHKNPFSPFSSRSPSFRHSLFYSPSPSRVAALRAAQLPTLAWISCHGDGAQITNNGMLIMVITLWGLFQEKWAMVLFFGRLRERKCQRWGSLDNIIRNRASIADLLDSWEQQSPSFGAKWRLKLTALAAEGISGKSGVGCEGKTRRSPTTRLISSKWIYHQPDALEWEIYTQ